MPSQTRWSHDELKCAVDAYARMCRWRAAGQSYSTAAIREAAIAGLLAGRSARAFDMRMANISHILDSYGEDWLPEFPPLPHVGGNIEREILDMLTEPGAPGDAPSEQPEEEQVASTTRPSDREVPGQSTSTNRQTGSIGREDQLLQGTDDPISLEEAASTAISRIPKASGSGPAFKPNGVEALVRRFGFDGAEPGTLQEAADLVGLSRERVRQLQREIEEWMEIVGQAPADDVPAVVREMMQIAEAEPTEALGRTLVERGLCQGNWSLGSVVELARIYGLRSESETIERDASTCGNRARRLNTVRSLCAKAVWNASGKSGFGFVSAISMELDALLSERLPDEPPVGADELRRALRSSDKIIPLPQDFYYVVRSRATVVETTKRMLSVNQPLTIGEVRAGLRRRFAFRKISFHLTSEVLSAFFNWHEAFVVDDSGRLSPATPMERRDDTLQAWMVREIESSDYGLLTRNQIIERGIKARKNRNSVGIYLTYGEQIAHDVRGFYYPIGARPTPHQIEEGLELAQAIVLPTIQRWHYDANGESLTVLLELGHSTIGSGVLTADAGSRGVLELIADDKYPLFDENGERHGYLSRSEAFSALVGLGTYLAHKYAEPGDYLLIRFDLTGITASAQVGGSELAQIVRMDG